MIKALVGGARWLFVCLIQVTSLAADKAALFSHFTPGSGVWSPEGLSAPPVIYWVRAGFSRGLTGEGFTPLPLGKRPHMPFKDLGAVIPHLPRHLSFVCLCSTWGRSDIYIASARFS